MSLDTRSMMQPAAIGGLALGVASQIPIINFLNCACCALVIGGGMLASYLYFKDRPPVAQPAYGEGAVLGLITGAIGAVVSTVISIPVQLLMGAVGMGGMGQLQEMLEEADVPEEVADLLASLAGGGLSVGVIIIGFFFSLVVYAIFATVGGLIGTAVFQKKVQAGPTAPVVPPTGPPGP